MFPYDCELQLSKCTTKYPSLRLKLQRSEPTHPTPDSRKTKTPLLSRILTTRVFSVFTKRPIKHPKNHEKAASCLAGTLAIKHYLTFSTWTFFRS